MSSCQRKNTFLSCGCSKLLPQLFSLSLILEVNSKFPPKVFFFLSPPLLTWEFKFLFIDMFRPILRETSSFSGASQHLRVLSCLPVSHRASSLSSATVNRESGQSTSGPTADSWFALVGITRPLPCVTPHLTPVNLIPKVASPNQKASAVWTIGSPSINHKLTTSPARKVRASRSRRRSKGIFLQEMDLMVGLWAGARSHWDPPLAKATSVHSLSLTQ